jgi:hypothetical protein
VRDRGGRPADQASTTLLHAMFLLEKIGRTPTHMAHMTVSEEEYVRGEALASGAHTPAS